MFNKYTFFYVIIFLHITLPVNAWAATNVEENFFPGYFLESEPNVSMDMPVFQECTPTSTPFCISQDTVFVGEEVCLSVTAQNYEDVLGFQFTLSFDTTILSFDTIILSGIIDDLVMGNFFLDLAEGGLITVLYFSSDGFTSNTLVDGDEIFQICFTAKSEGESDVTFVNQPTEILVINSNLEEIPFSGGDGNITVLICSDITTTVDTTICPGESVIIGNIEYAAAGMYTITLPIDNGCDSIITLNLSIGDVGYTIPPLVEVCQGETPVTISVPDGFEIGLNPPPVSQAVVLAPGDYTVIVEDLTSGCQEEQMITIVELPLPEVDIAGVLSFCAGDSTILTASGAEGYLWSDGSTEPTLFVTDPGTYSVTGTDSNGCENTAEVTVEELPLPEIIILGDLGFCIGDSTTLIATGAETYLWNDGSTASTLSVTSLGTYSVTGTDINGCSNIAEVVIEEFPLPEVEITGNFEFCAGEEAVLIINPLLPDADYSYEWSNGVPGVNFSTPNGGTYNVTVTDNATACFIVEEFEVIENPLPVITINGNAEFCEGDQTILTASGASAYIWNTGETTASITVVQSGIYAVTGTDSNACTAVAEIEVIRLPLPVIAFVGETEVCGSELALITASGGVDYVWSGGESPFTAANLLAQGTYSVTVTDANGCSDTAGIIIEGDLTVPDFIYCPPNILQYINAGNTETSVSWVEPLVEDNCGDFVTISSTHTAGDLFNLGTTIVTYTAIDADNNEASCSFEVTIEESAPLTFFVDTLDYTSSNDTFYVPISVLDFDDVIAFQYTIIAPDLDLSSIIGIESTGALDDNGDLGGIITVLVDPNTIQILWTDSGGTGVTLPDSTDIFNLVMIISAPFGSCVPVEFSNEPLDIEAFQQLAGTVLPTVRNGEVCVKNLVDIEGEIYRIDEMPINRVNVNLNSIAVNIADTTDIAGRYAFLDQMGGDDYTITPDRNFEHSVGVTVSDLAIILQHILGVNFITDPYLLIAADVNNDGGVTVSDILEAREVILSNIPEFPFNTSWRFIPVEYTFPLPSNPWAEIFPESVSLDDLEDSAVVDFFGIKIGDINLSANTQFAPDDIFYLSLDNQDIRKGQIISVPVQVSNMDKMGGLQFALNFDENALEFLNIETGNLPAFSPVSKLLYKYSARTSALSLLWLNDNTPIEDDKNAIAVLQFKVKQTGELADYLYLQKRSGFNNEAVTKENVSLGVDLDFNRITSTSFVTKERMEILTCSPNPFNEEMNIQFSLEKADNILLQVFDVSGKQLLSQEKHYTEGTHNWMLRGTDLAKSGIYLIRLQSTDFIATARICKQ